MFEAIKKIFALGFDTQIGNQEYWVVFSNPHTSEVQTIYDNGREFQLIEMAAASDIEYGFRQMIDESMKTGGRTVVADVNGRAVIATYSMTIEQVRRIYDANCKNIADAYKQLMILKEELRSQYRPDTPKELPKHVTEILEQGPKSPTEPSRGNSRS